MPSLIGIRRRIKSSKNISQITKAMEMVSASKMKKAQEATLASRPFSEKLETIIQNIAGSAAANLHPLMRQNHNPKTAMIIVVSTNKGLCGPLNVNLFRKVFQWADQESVHEKLLMVHVNKKARTSLPQRKEHELLAAFNDFGENISFEESRSISKLAIESFKSGQVDEVYVAYPRFISTLQNIPTIKKLLPISLAVESVSRTSDYTFEPSNVELLQELVPYQVEMSLYQILNDSSASEHSARMVAMKSASDNAVDLIHNLTLDYNQARQSAVTTEILDATTARMAIN
jgi:F-type H+-transporting ATPase subunit gamma